MQIQYSLSFSSTFNLHQLLRENISVELEKNSTFLIQLYYYWRQKTASGKPSLQCWLCIQAYRCISGLVSLHVYQEHIHIWMHISTLSDKVTNPSAFPMSSIPLKIMHSKVKDINLHSQANCRHACRSEGQQRIAYSWNVLQVETPWGSDAVLPLQVATGGAFVMTSWEGGQRRMRVTELRHLQTDGSSTSQTQLCLDG